MFNVLFHNIWCRKDTPLTFTGANLCKKTHIAKKYVNYVMICAYYVKDKCFLGVYSLKKSGAKCSAGERQRRKPHQLTHNTKVIEDASKEAVMVSCFALWYCFMVMINPNFSLAFSVKKSYICIVEFEQYFLLIKLRPEPHLNIFCLRLAYDNCRKQVVSQTSQQRVNIGGRTEEEQRNSIEPLNF